MFEDKEESREAESNSEHTFYYNRKERLEKAPKIVQDYYNGNFELQKGFRVLFKNRGNRFLLITLFTLTAFALIFSRIENSKNKSSTKDFSFELTAFAYEDEIFSVLKIADKSKKENSEREPVVFKVEFSAINSDNQIVDVQSEERLFQSKEEIFRTRITNFEITEINAVITWKKEKIELSTNVKK